MNILNKVTLKTLAKNNIRTLVTIIGIILSAAMITAVTTCISSLQNFLVDVVIEQDGDWHGMAYGVSKSQADSLKNEPEVDSCASIQNIGYALLEDGKNEFKPYLFIGGISENFTDMLPVNITSGRMPRNPSEIILPKHLQTNGGVKYSVGDTLSLDVGNRVSEGKLLVQNVGYLAGKDGKAEEFVISGRRTYTVVGIYERPSFESYSAPGYTALTIEDGTNATYDVYIKMKNAKNIYKFLYAKLPENRTRTNSDLLRFTGASDDKNFNAVLYSLAGILIAIIMLGSISLIYNAFSISVSERTKQFGILSSVGATKRQIRRCVLFEALFLSIIGIPLGILAGIAGIGITFELTRDLFMSFLNTGNNSPHLSVSWPAVAAAAIVGLATVLISAYIPARRAVRISAIDAIRQTSDIKINARKIKTSRLTYKLFGLEGMIAAKNFKRNKKKYRSTVISLFISVVLFISASSFCAYINISSDSLVQKYGYDIIYPLTANIAKDSSLQALYGELSAIGGVTKAGYAFWQNATVKIASTTISKDYMEYHNSRYARKIPPDGVFEANALIYFINDELYEEYLDENSLDKSAFMNASVPVAVALDFMKVYDNNEERYYTFNLLNARALDVSFVKAKEIEGYYYSDKEADENGVEYFIYKNEKGEQIRLAAGEASEEVKLRIGTVAASKPFCVDNNYSGITLLYPYSSMSKVLGKTGGNVKTILYFKADNHKSVHDKIYSVLEEKAMPTTGLLDIAEPQESTRALVSVVNIFSYGFIILISLIAAANVFNTISTNIGLRRREFAMLKSIGMTQKGFNRMMNFECLLYGIKGLIYGIPVSIEVTYLIYRSISRGWKTSFFIPWHSVVIAVGSVFAVVFATMLYSMDKIKKDNPIDALKNENL